MLLQTVNPPIIQFNPQLGGQIKDIYLLYCYGGDGEVTGQTTIQFMQFSIPDVGGIKNMVIFHQHKGPSDDTDD